MFDQINRAYARIHQIFFTVAFEKVKEALQIYTTRSSLTL